MLGRPHKLVTRPAWSRRLPSGPDPSRPAATHRDLAQGRGRTVSGWPRARAGSRTGDHRTGR
jgi:hypothetical protein